MPGVQSETTFHDQLESEIDEFTGGVGGNGDPRFSLFDFLGDEKFHACWGGGEIELPGAFAFAMLLVLIIKEFSFW